MGKQLTEWTDGPARLSVYRLHRTVSVKLDDGAGGLVERAANLPAAIDAACAFQHIQIAIEAHDRENPEAPIAAAYLVGAEALTDWAVEAIQAYKQHLLATAYCTMYQVELAEADPTDGIHIYCDTEGAVQPDAWVPWSVVRSELERNHKFPQEAC